jgi:hypothetical protein
MLRKIHETNYFHRKFMGRISIKCQNGPVLPPTQVFYFNGQACVLAIPTAEAQAFLIDYT